MKHPGKWKKTTKFTPNSDDNNIIGQIMKEHSHELISDEQIERVLAPIRARINAGEFSKQRRRNKKILISTLGGVALLALMAVALLFWSPLQAEVAAGQAQDTQGRIMEIEAPSIPQAGISAELAVKAEDFTLENGQTSEIVTAAGETIPDGTWRILATLDGQRIEIGWITVENGTTRLIE